MTSKPISPLRQRMINDMSVRNFVPDTQREYIRAVKKLAGFLKRSPETATAEELRAFQLQLIETANPPTINATVTALRFFFKITLDQPETTRHLVFVHEPPCRGRCSCRGHTGPGRAAALGPPRAGRR